MFMVLTPWHSNCESSFDEYSTSTGTDGRFARHAQSPRVTQGVEAPPRTSTSHLATDLGSRPPAAQSRSELSLATRPGPRTMEATRGNGYAPVRGTPAMMVYSVRMISQWGLTIYFHDLFFCLSSLLFALISLHLPKFSLPFIPPLVCFLSPATASVKCCKPSAHLSAF